MNVLYALMVEDAVSNGMAIRRVLDEKIADLGKDPIEATREKWGKGPRAAAGQQAMIEAIGAEENA